MMYGLVTLTHLADSVEQLDEDTEALLAIGRTKACQFATLNSRRTD